eukprot:5205539-Amphidinium_carterae.1
MTVFDDGDLSVRSMFDDFSKHTPKSNRTKATRCESHVRWRLWEVVTACSEMVASWCYFQAAGGYAMFVALVHP